MRRLTRDGNATYPSNARLRKEMADTLCATCFHIPDMCVKLVMTTKLENDCKVVINCEGYEDIASVEEEYRKEHGT